MKKIETVVSAVSSKLPSKEAVVEVLFDVGKRVAYATLNAAVLSFVTRKVNEALDKDETKSKRD